MVVRDYPRDAAITPEEEGDIGFVVTGVIRGVMRAAWAALTGQSQSADLFPF